MRTASSGREIGELTEKLLNSPAKKLDKQEAIYILQRCGILDKNGEITEAYKGIIIRKEDK